MRHLPCRQFAVLMLVASLVLGACPVHADDAVVGSGTPASCTDAAIDNAMNLLYPGANFPGGTLSFNCGPNPHTILINNQKGLTGATTVDGGNLITLDAQNLTRHFVISGAESRVELRRIVLRSGRANNGFGGAVYVSNATHLGVYDSILRDNIADVSGGAIAAEGGASVRVQTSSLIANRAGHGGAISSSGGLSIVDCLVAFNDATIDQGGAIQQWFGGIDIVRTRFEFNDSINAGAILLRGNLATLTDVTFRDNYALDRGGAIAMYEGAFAYGMNLVFERNHASQGGAAHIGGVDLGTPANGAVGFGASFTFDGARFVDNHADQSGVLPRHGGALYVFGLPPDHRGSIGSVHVADAVFDGNTAARGGAIHSQGLLKIVASTLERNSAQYGGALLLEQSCFLNCPNGTDATVHVERSTFQGNAATEDGGALYNHLGLPKFDEVNFIENSAARGGAIATYGYLNKQSRFSVLRNVAATAGGGIHFEPVPGDFIGGEFVNTTFSGNRVVAPAGRGGDLHLDSSGSNSLVALRLYHDTLIGGAAAVGKSIFHAGNVENLVEIESSVIQGDAASAGLACEGDRDIDSDGGNFMPASCDANVGASTDVVVGVNFDLRLGALTQDDEFQWSHIPNGNSPLIDTVSCSVIGQDARTLDQRDRPTGVHGLCDAGAIERQLVEGPTSNTLFANGFEG